jgi:hypothetical protein
MTATSTVRATSLTDQRLRIAREADAKAEQANATVLANGFTIPWDSVLDGVSEVEAEGIVDDMGNEVHTWMRNQSFRDTITALAINGAGLAAWTQRQNEILAGFTDARKVQVFTFKEPALNVPTKAIEYWRKLLGLSEEQADKLASIDTRGEAAKIADRVATALIERLQKIHDETISEGTNLSEFIAKVREIAPDASRSLLETEYRTHMATVYGQQLHEQIVSRANAFPFIQAFVILDSRTTDFICRPMGTAGPNGRGYIAATTDPTWVKWKFPAHWKCRSQQSPVSYREAQRLGILADDGKTKIAIIGNNPDRPYGDPTKFATGQDGELHEVKPQKGFGG